ncbi:MAG: hypothetical protein V9G09_02755 [Candidatus Nanopelagicales bacterium]
MPYCEYPSPVGILTLVADDEGLQAVWWPDDARSTEVGEFQPDHPVLAQAAAELDEYFAGRRTTFDVPLDPIGHRLPAGGLGRAAHHPLRHRP